MRLTSYALSGICTILPALATAAEPTSGLSFEHKDWQLVCDNTRTCRAAGYTADGDEMPVSMLLTRKAGPNEAVTGEVMIGNYGNEEMFKKLPKVFKLTMRVNGKDIGKLEIPQSKMSAELSAQQLNTLLTALPHASTIELIFRDKQWQVSDQGAAAVLLKMDEFQGRIGTKGALVKKGNAGEEQVLPALPVPVVIVAPISKARSGDAAMIKKVSQDLRKELLKSLKGDDDCIELQKQQKEATSFEVNRLTENKLLVSVQCWNAAYNFGYGFWVINDKAPFQPVLVTTNGSEYNDGDDGTIYSSLKGRGVGDCWEGDNWTWDGKQFTHTESSSSGMCRLIAPGGAWHLPTVVSEIRHAKP